MMSRQQNAQHAHHLRGGGEDAKTAAILRSAPSVAKNNGARVLAANGSSALFRAVPKLRWLSGRKQCNIARRPRECPMLELHKPPEHAAIAKRAAAGGSNACAAPLALRR